MSIDSKKFDDAIDAAEQRAKDLADAIDKAFKTTPTVAPAPSNEQAQTAGAGYAKEFAKGFLGANAVQDIVSGLWNFTKEGIQNAGNLQSAQRAVELAYGENAGAATEFAQSAKENFGMAESTALDFLARYRNMWEGTAGITSDMKDQMSMDMTGLIGDYASLYNTDFETGFTRLKAVITGKTEAIEDWGISMHQATMEEYAMTKGLETSYKSMTESEKRMLRYDYVMEQSANVQGHFAENQDLYNNQLRLFQENMKELGTEMGGGFIPLLASVMGFTNDLMEGPEENKLQKQIESAKKEAAALAESLGIADQNYSLMMGTIEARAKVAEEQLAIIEKINSQGEKTEEDWKTLHDATTALLAAYPQLRQFVDEETGAFTGNTAAIRENIKALNELSIASAAEYIRKEYEKTYGEASKAYIAAKKEEISLQEKYNAELAKQAELQKVQQTFADQGGAQLFYGDHESEFIQQVDGLEKFYEVHESGAATLRDQYVLNGKVVTGAAIEIAALIEEALGQQDLATENAQENLEKQQETVKSLEETMGDIAEQYQEDIELLNGLAGATEEVNGASSDLESQAGATAEAIQNMFPRVSPENVTGSLAAVDIAMSGLIAKAAATAAAISAVFALNPGLGFPSAGQYATGLERVPYDGFPAILHKDEMVLDRKDANAYRNGDAPGQERGNVTVNQYISAVPQTPSELAFVTANALEMLRFNQ